MSVDSQKELRQTNRYDGKLITRTDATSRSEARTTIPSSKTRHASFTTGKSIISTISWSVTNIGCKKIHKNDRLVILIKLELIRPL